MSLYGQTDEIAWQETSLGVNILLSWRHLRSVCASTTQSFDANTHACPHEDFNLAAGRINLAIQGKLAVHMREGTLMGEVKRLSQCRNGLAPYVFPSLGIMPFFPHHYMARGASPATRTTPFDCRINRQCRKVRISKFWIWERKSNTNG